VLAASSTRLLKKAHLRRCRAPAALRRTDSVRLAPRRVPIEDGWQRLAAGHFWTAWV